MSVHLQEREIDLLVTSPESLPERERRRCLAHLNQCALCQEHLKVAREFYADFRERLEKGESGVDSTVANRILKGRSALQLSRFDIKRTGELATEITQFSEVKPALVFRLFKLAARHPVQTAVGTGLIAAAILLAVNLVRSPQHPIPAYATVEKGRLSIYDKEGSPLWKKNASGMREGSTLSEFRNERGEVIQNPFILIDDVLSRPGPEVLIHGYENDALPSSGFSPETLYCFDSRGELVWSRSYAVSEFPSIFNQKGGNWRINGMFTLKTSNEKPTRLFVYAHEAPFSPAALMEVDAATGVELQTYLHFGSIKHAFSVGIQGEDSLRIIAYGIDNAYNRAFLAVLDPDMLTGVGPTPAGFHQARGNRSKPATEIYYLQFPRSQFGKNLSRSLYNSVKSVQTAQDGSFIVTVNEFPDEDDELRGTILYSLDENLRVKSVTFSDDLMRTYERVEQEGERYESLDDRYAKVLMNEVRYWDGDRFVATQTRNRRYSQKMNF